MGLPATGFGGPRLLWTAHGRATPSRTIPSTKIPRRRAIARSCLRASHYFSTDVWGLRDGTAVPNSMPYLRARPRLTTSSSRTMTCSKVWAGPWRRGGRFRTGGSRPRFRRPRHLALSISRRSQSEMRLPARDARQCTPVRSARRRPVPASRPPDGSQARLHHTGDVRVLGPPGKRRPPKVR
jgi:hypothetical protein